MGVRVATGAETVACERATMEMGVSSAELMRRAGEGAADEIARVFGNDERSRIVVFAGSGNNGGDGWVAAAALVRMGFPVNVAEIGTVRSAESRDARSRALTEGVVPGSGDEPDARVVVDALLGTGSTGIPRGEVALAIGEIARRRVAGAKVVAIDLPSGVDATTGDREGSVHADITVSFGTVKRGHLLARDVCGEIVILDIGLGETEATNRLPALIDAAWVRERVPSIAWSAHKGTRKRLAIVGGGKGMAGAVILAGEGALRSGIGLLRIVGSEASALPVHAGIPSAIFQPWPDTPGELARLVANVDTIAIGPGLGVSAATRELVERILLAWSGPVVLDADALNIFEGDTASLSALLRGRPAVITPHPREMGRLLGVSTDEVQRNRFEIGVDVSRTLGAAVLLKGSPTVVFSPTGERWVSAAGTAALATGGSGDILTGMTGTLLAQMSDRPEGTGYGAGDLPAVAAACAAFIHGRAAELCGVLRGTTLDDVLHAMPIAWNEPLIPPSHGEMARLESHS